MATRTATNGGTLEVEAALFDSIEFPLDNPDKILAELRRMLNSGIQSVRIMPPRPEEGSRGRTLYLEYIIPEVALGSHGGVYVIYSDEKTYRRIRMMVPGGAGNIVGDHTNSYHLREFED
ncbi:MAG: hypothetical protein ABIA93_04035 [Candidatus Woesearchaeota archaeon]